MENSKSPLAYKAKVRCCDESHSFDVDEGDQISLEEYESLPGYFRGNFTPIFEGDEDADEVLADYFGLLQ